MFGVHMWKASCPPESAHLNLLSVFSSFLLQVWLSCCWTSCSRRAMVWALVSLSSLQPTSVRLSSGRPSAPPPSTLAEVRALPLNTFWSDVNAPSVFFFCNKWPCDSCGFFRYWVWGSYHCSLSSAGHPHRQGARPARSLLQTEPSQPHEPHCHRLCVCSRHILPGELETPTECSRSGSTAVFIAVK